MKLTSSILVIIVGFACLGLADGIVMAQDSQTSEKDWEDFDQDNFDDSSTTIDNEWFPLKPGMQWIYEGVTVEDNESMPHRVIFTVTNLTKVISGVRTVVCWDQDYSDEELVEAEIVFFAQDKDGNVWHLGQYPEEYEEGKFITAPAWLHGIGDGRAGIMMKANPQLGTPSYSQGWAPSVDWTDRAVVDQMGQETTVPAGTYKHVLVTAEYARTEPNAYQLKYYALGVGNVRVGWRGEDATQETLKLVKVEQLSQEAMAEARGEALKLETRAYKNSKGVYAYTQPAE